MYLSGRFGSKAVFAKRPQSARSNGIDSSSPTGTVVPKLEFVRNHFEKHDPVETTAQLGKHDHLVFTRAGFPISQVNTKSWRDAVARAGIQNFRWHDLRHTWASWLVQNGTPLYDLQEMGSWKSADMVRRYAHLGSAQMSRHAEVVGRILEGTNLSQADEVDSKDKGPACG